MAESNTNLISGIPDVQARRLLAVLARQSKIKGVTLFGSRALDKHRPASDIDLCIHAADLTLSEKLALDNAIDDLLLPWKVDLVLWQAIDNPALMAHIQRAGRLLVSAPSAASGTGSSP